MSFELQKKDGTFTTPLSYANINVFDINGSNPTIKKFTIVGGTKSITENGTHDISSYENVNVQVQAAGETTLEATYSGGDVPVGTDPSTLTIATILRLPDRNVTVSVTGATVSGNIQQGENILNVTYGGLSTTVIVRGFSPISVTHTATFKAGDDVVRIVTFYEGQTSIDEPTVPEKEHYTGAWPSYTLGTTDIIINAVYTAITYTITFRDDGGNHPQNYTEPTAGRVTAPTPTPRSGYTVEWPSWAVEYNNSQVVEAVYTEIVASGVSMKIIRPGTTKSGKITIEPNSSVTKYSSHLPSEAKSLAFDVSNFTGVAGDGCPTHCKITAAGTPSANTLKNSGFDITNDGGTITATNVTGTGMYSVEYVPVGTTNYPYGGLGLYPRAQFDGGIEYTIVLSW